MKKSILILCVLLATFTAKAQVINVCGTDSIVLQVENYDGRGVIEWQESIDSINWVTIPEFVGEMYRFFPTETKYYRAVVKTSTCDALYSAFSFVQLPPIANAGVDKVVGGKTTILLGNKLLGATGEWTVLAGDSGILAEPRNPYSQFSGKYSVPYKLKWTVTNGCGQSSDTINVQFEKVIVNKNFIVVDNTDSIYSDSTEMATGLYRIKFSDSTIVPYDSVLLIGIRDSISFLRRVISFTLQESIYSLNTEQGKLIDLFESGSLDIGNAINESILNGSNGTQKSRVKVLNTFPLRQDIIDNINNQGIIVVNSIHNSANRIPGFINNSNEDKTLNLSFPTYNLELIDNALKFSLKELDFSLSPNFVSSFDWNPFELKIGMENAVFKKNLKYKIEANATVDNFFKENEIIGEPFNRTFLILGVPVVLNISLKAKFDVKMEVGASMERTENYTNTFTAVVKARNTSDSELVFNSSDQSSTSIATSLNGGFKTEFKIGPEVSFKIFDVLGPYFWIPLKMEVLMKANTDLNWTGSASIGFEGNIGVKAEIDPVKIWGVKIYEGCVPFNFYHDFFGDKNIDEYKWPSKLELLSGNFQKGKANTKLANPIIFKVVSTSGVGVPLVPVRFELEDGNGTVNQYMVFSDISGQVSINWTLGSNTKCNLKAYVLDYQNINIENSPIYVTASAEGVSTSCENSNLAISIKTIDTYKYPLVSGGMAPYTYSTNATTYSSTVPHYSLSLPGNFIVYVKDKNGCSVTKSFTITAPNACTNSDLKMDITVVANILKITGIKGTSPYQYAIDNNSSFSTVNTYSNLTAGVHTIYIKDAKGCLVSSEVKFDTNIQAAIKASYPAQGATSIALSPNTFKWVAATYATNQVYDLYLKKGTDAYTLIASNLSATSFSYTSALLASTAYTWKVAVKTGNTVLDNSEFTFTTASGVATAPTEPILLEPRNERTIAGLALTLKWQPQSGEFKYDVYLDTKDASTLVAMNLSNVEYPVNNFVDGKTYYWKIKIKSIISGASITSSVWSFVAYKNNLFNPNLTYGTMSDVEGNTYKTIQIGTQIWMAENLRTTHYSNGEVIPNVNDGNDNENFTGTAWGALNSGAQCTNWKNMRNDYIVKFGRLYNWFAVVDSRKLAPVGWHVPTEAEWSTLENYLIANGFNYDGTTTGNKIGKAVAGTTDWTIDIPPTTEGQVGGILSTNNSSGFTGLPGGSCPWIIPSLSYLGGSGHWWTASENGYNNAWSRGIAFPSYGGLVKAQYPNDKRYGLSIRCIKDVVSPNPLNIETVNIPAGTFTMGSPESEEGHQADETRHQVTLSAFRISKFEITNVQFAAFLNAKGIGSDLKYSSETNEHLCDGMAIYESINYTNNHWVPNSGNENKPISCLWFGANEYAKYVGGRLPTEAEWEYACRAGTTTPFNTGTCLTNTQANYNWASPYGSCTNTNTYSYGFQDVGTYPPNSFGLYDMHGNISEWCNDFYGIYSTNAQINPTGPTNTGSSYSHYDHVYRGGNNNHFSSATSCRSARRDYFGNYTGTIGFPGLGVFGKDIGFRVVFPVNETPQTEVTDIDGNVYHTVKIGTQTWMVENLRTTRYRNGDAIPNVTDNANWARLTTGAWCDYNNNASNGIKYGKLYNWYAVADIRNIAPAGWHVPTDSEWSILTDYLGGENVAGNKLKVAGTIYWLNSGSTNETGFSAFPVGSRNYDGPFENIENFSVHWWSSTPNVNDAAWSRSLVDNFNTGVGRDYAGERYGFSVRCIKD